MSMKSKAKPVLITIRVLLILLVLALIATVWAVTWHCAPSSFSVQPIEELSTQLSAALFSHAPIRLQEGHLNALLLDSAQDLSLPENIEILGLQVRDNIFTLWVKASVWKLSSDIAIQGTLTFDERYETLHADVQTVTAGKIPLPAEKICALLQENGVPLTGNRMSFSIFSGIPLQFGGINFRLYIESMEFFPYRIDVKLQDLDEQKLAFIAQFFS